jgi:hypothetical protein
VQQRNEEREVGRLRLVLVEGESKKSKPDAFTWHGRTDQNKRLVFPMRDDLHCRTDKDVSALLKRLQSTGGGMKAHILDDYAKIQVKPGDYAVVEVTEARGHTLRGKLLWSTTLSSFAGMNLSLDDEQLLKEALSPDRGELESITA